ncbi:hypothetical protein [Agrobacterium rosae]|uniref:hypothetical protein n=1 Tax=Agrobacterium rosae TaxID=1972867 RepID=UPI00122F5D71|nr:hypothetical protein [Agrobacterium rosae]KAA3510098.1 hypothetical protein DXM21_19910 [Agrobacterium rosae]KAA3514957.1 hypothetical protein DXM25_20460 [Agrobacterium rosae]MQB50718.1 hypothetical protein [Agrobacterium rosae]
MTASRASILQWIADLASSIVTDAEDVSDIASRIANAPDLDASAFALEVLALTRVVAENADATSDFDLIGAALQVDASTLSIMKTLQAMAMTIAGVRISWPSRPSARRARARISLAGDDALGSASALGAAGAQTYAWLSSLVAVSCRLISDIAANAAPIVQVQTGVSLPSTVLAYQLYGDANRAGAMIDIAGASTPLVMPTHFDALAS